MKKTAFLLLLILVSCGRPGPGNETHQPCHTPPSQLKIKSEFNSIILDGFCDSTEMVQIMDSLLQEQNRSWCHGFRTDSAFELFYRNGPITKEEGAYLWKNYLGVFRINKREMH